MNICGMRGATASHDAVAGITRAAAAETHACALPQGRPLAQFHPSLLPAKPTITPEVPRPGQMSFYLDAESFAALAAGLSARACRPPRHIR
jgi:hypothetical protein